MKQSQDAAHELTRFAFAFVALIFAGLMGTPMLNTLSYDPMHIRMIPILSPEPVFSPVQLTPDVTAPVTAVQHGKKKLKSLTSLSSQVNEPGTNNLSITMTVRNLPPRSPDAVSEPMMLARAEPKLNHDGPVKHRL